MTDAPGTVTTRPRGAKGRDSYPRPFRHGGQHRSCRLPERTSHRANVAQSEPTPTPHRRHSSNCLNTGVRPRVRWTDRRFDHPARISIALMQPRAVTGLTPVIVINPADSVDREYVQGYPVKAGKDVTQIPCGAKQFIDRLFKIRHPVTGIPDPNLTSRCVERASDRARPN